MVNIRHYREFQVCTTRDHQVPISMADTDTLITERLPVCGVAGYLFHAAGMHQPRAPLKTLWQFLTKLNTLLCDTREKSHP